MNTSGEGDAAGRTHERDLSPPKWQGPWTEETPEAGQRQDCDGQEPAGWWRAGDRQLRGSSEWAEDKTADGENEIDV